MTRFQFISLFLAFIVIISGLILSSCNLTRVVTTSAEHYQRGDTTVTIMTKTTESYDASVKPENLLKK